MTVGDWFALGGLTIAALTAVGGVWMRGETSRGRIYTRLDESKKDCRDKLDKEIAKVVADLEKNYVRKDVYDLRVLQVEQTIAELKALVAQIPTINANVLQLLTTKNRRARK